MDFWGLLRKKSLEEIFNEIWPMARNNNLQIESVYYKKLGKNLEGIGFIRIFATEKINQIRIFMKG